MEKFNLTKAQIIIECCLLLLIFMSLGLGLSLVSYYPDDTSWSHTSTHDYVHNFCGYLGAYVADVFLQFLGLVAFFIPFFLIIFCVKLVFFVKNNRAAPVNYFKLTFRLIGLFGFIFAATSFFSINIPDPVNYSAGGIIGDIVGSVLLSLMDNVFISVLLLLIAFSCITLINDFSWLNFMEKLGDLVIRTSLLVWGRFFSVSVEKTAMRKKIHRHKHESVLKTNSIGSSRQHWETSNEAEKPLSSSIQFSSEEQQYNEELAQILNDDAVTKKFNQRHFMRHDQLNESNTFRTSAFIKKTDENETLADETIDASIEALIAPPPFLNETAINENKKYSQTETVDANETTTRYSMKSTVTHDLTLSDPIIMTENEADENQPIDDIYLSNADTLINDKIVQEREASIQHNVNQSASQTDRINTTVINDVDHVMSEKHAHIIVDTATESVEVDEQKNSLIHPFLQRRDQPLVKPTTPLPSLDLLTMPPNKQIDVDHEALAVMSELIEQSLADYRVKTKVVDYQPGPVITRFEIELAPGIKAARISTLDRDLARSLSMPSVRVVEVIPGKPYVGIELPNENRQTVYFREVLDSPQFRDSISPLTIVLGKDISGQSVVADLSKMPHVLVAGTTGSGKSVGVNAMILSILYKSQPEDVRFIMIDPKMLELSIYEGIPHLLTPVVTDMKDASNALNWCVNEMEKRYRLMSALGVRNISGYNDKIKQAAEMDRPIPDPLWKPTDSMDIDMPVLTKLPYIVVLVDEFADLIMAVGKKVEELIARLAQKARAAGIHLVLATQRPSVDVITGLIKANIPTRIAFTVSSKIDSRTILDQMGAESLLGMGDMLYLAPNSSIPIRVHGAFVRDEEVHAVVQDWKARAEPKYIDNITASVDDSEMNTDASKTDELDPLFDQVVAFVIETRRASISSVQRKFRIGYNRAARIVEQMENEGIISSPSHNGNREVLARSYTD